MKQLSVEHCPHCGNYLRARDSIGYFALVGRLVSCDDCEVDWHIIQEEDEDEPQKGRIDE